MLLAIDECGSIRGAARKLGMDQPHISRQLRRVEESLRLSVFVRSAGGVSLTPPGVRVLALARRALDVIDEITVPAVEDLGTAAVDLLRVLYCGVPAFTVLDDLAVEYPDLRAEFGSTTPAAAVEELRAGRADVFLGTRLPHVQWPGTDGVAAVSVLADPTHVHLSAGHPLAAAPELRLSDLAGERWIVGTDDDSRTATTEECRLVGGFEPLLTHRVDDESTVCALLAQGRGIMLGSSVAANGPGTVGRPYRGASPAHWMQVYEPGRLGRELAATVSELLRDRHERWTRAFASPGPAAPTLLVGRPRRHGR